MKIGGYKIFKEGRRVVAHHSACHTKGCKAHEVTATKSELKRMLAGKLNLLGDRSVSYPDSRHVKVGCTTLTRARLAKLIQLL